MLANDPLATRIGSLERRRRLIADFSYAQQRLVTCLGQRSAGSHADDAAALAREAETFLEGLKRPAACEQDTIESGVDVMDRASRKWLTPAERRRRSIERWRSSGAHTERTPGERAPASAQQLRLRENQLFLILTIVIGVVAGLAAVLFTVAIEQTSHRLFGLAPSRLRLFAVPPLMSLVTGFLLAKVFPDVRGSGVPQTEAAYHLPAA